ncbi:hypothetical protein KOW79_011201 [Hemibagrus wyckioides]|uniref:Uncharacterized protein n=1 Tax=Hemibagrus wyckioides TaxID=337641 RepID=A0A9D3NPS1_9TELE|nr:hypothetical protein KOW79_011201 [Hemibagrus wyckioides]
MFCESVCDPEASRSALHDENDQPQSDEENSSLRSLKNMSPSSPPLSSLRKNPSPTLQPPSPMPSLHIIKVGRLRPDMLLCLRYRHIISHRLHFAY